MRAIQLMAVILRTTGMVACVAVFLPVIVLAWTAVAIQKTTVPSSEATSLSKAPLSTHRKVLLPRMALLTSAGRH